MFPIVGKNSLPKQGFRALISVIFTLTFLVHDVQPVAVMAVDVGSEWMKIAIVSPGVPMEIILNTDSQRKTPVAVAFRDGERYIGDSAINVGIRFPEKTFTHFVDLMGKTDLESVAVKKYHERFPYHTLVKTGNSTIGFVVDDDGQKMTFTPEELLSMILAKARHFAELASASSSSTGLAQVITDCVITVPPYFSQAERRAVKHAAYLAGLKVLQLINVNSAFALNYGVFRRKDFNTTNPTNILFYDMGAGSTLATIASYQLVKTKERGFTQTDPQLTIKGVAYDRYMGGFELQLRLRDHLLKLFAEQSKKTMDEIRKNKRAMAKLLKEAGRLKKVLSANQEHKAQIENVMNDIDLKATVTREQFETLAADLLNERVVKPLDEVFKSSGITFAEIDSFVIIGGCTRIPKIQDLLQSYLSRELSKNINADEAGALGAVYQAAFLSKGFKVKTFHLKDYNLYQINVDFDRETNDGSKKTVSRTLFARGNSYPQKKVITFSKNREDFDFLVHYVEPIPQDSRVELFKITLKNVKEIFEKYSANITAEPKGIKVHFRMDDSGILAMENCEASFEVEYQETIEKDNYENLSNLVGDAISKFGSKLSSLFGANEGLNQTDSNATDASQQNQTQNAEAENKTQPDSGESNLNKTDFLNLTDTLDLLNKTIKVEIKKKIVKEEIVSDVDLLDQFILAEEAIKASLDKLEQLNKREMEKLRRDQAKNALESFIHETRDKLNQDEFSSAATAEEIANLETELRAVSEWLDYESDGASAQDFEDRLKKLHDLTRELFTRVREHRERPEAMASLNEMLNIADMFHANALNVSKEEQIFNDNEMGSLRKVINETKNWMEESKRGQEALSRSDKPYVEVRYIYEKIAMVDREVKYLLNKAKISANKPKKPKVDDSTTKAKNDTKQDSNPESDPGSQSEPKEEATEEKENITLTGDDAINPDKTTSDPYETKIEL